MEIILIRHGKSVLIDKEPISCAELSKWVEKYDDAGISKEDPIPLETTSLISKVNVVLASDLRRAVQSANHLFPQKKVVIHSHFRETELPYPKWALRWKLKPLAWLIILRCLWFLGKQEQAESFKEAKKRAQHAANLLLCYGNQYGNVALVGHGVFNRLVSNELLKLGGIHKGKVTSRNWGCMTIKFENNIESTLK